MVFSLSRSSPFLFLSIYHVDHRVLVEYHPQLSLLKSFFGSRSLNSRLSSTFAADLRYEGMVIREEDDDNLIVFPPMAEIREEWNVAFYLGERATG